MAERMRLTDGSDTVDFSPLIDKYKRPDNRDRGYFEAPDGTRQLWDAGGAQEHSIALNDLSKTDADQLNTWWDNLTILTHTPDLTGASGTTVYARLTNKQKPFQMWFGTGWKEKYEGTITIQEVSSSSSSSG